MGVGGWSENYYIRNLPVVISLQTIDNRVIPDLSASGDIVVGHKENVLLAPLEAVDTERGKPVVYVKRGNSFARRVVQLGERNNTQVEILAGLRAGDEIALGRPVSAAAR
jgi:multidrug efflux pump subunit AcrA (membrane-fusion protein)